MKKQTKRLHRRRHRRKPITHRRKPITHRRKPITHRRRKHPEFMTLSRNRARGRGQSQRQGHGVILFSMPETQKSVEIIVDNKHKQFGNIIPGLREM